MMFDGMSFIAPIYGKANENFKIFCFVNISYELKWLDIVKFVNVIEDEDSVAEIVKGV